MKDSAASLIPRLVQRYGDTLTTLVIGVNLGLGCLFLYWYLVPGIEPSVGLDRPSPQTLSSTEFRELLQVTYGNSAGGIAAPAVTLVLGDICTSCGTGRIVDALDRLSSEYRAVHFQVLVADVNAVGAEVLQSNLNLRVPVRPFPDDVRVAWSHLEREFASGALEGVVLMKGKDEVEIAVRMTDGLDPVRAFLEAEGSGR